MPSSVPGPTRAAKEVANQLVLVRLQMHIRELQEKLSIFESLIDPEDIKAARLISRRTPSTATMLRIAALGGQPEGLGDEPDERSW